MFVLFVLATQGLGLSLTSSLTSNTGCPTLHVCQFSLATSLSSEVIRAVEVRSVSASGSFFQSAYTSNTAPQASAIPAQPTIACDSFVTFGLASVQPGAADCTALSPDFVFTESAFSGSYYCTNPGSSQVTVTSVAPLLVAQVSLGGTSTSIDLQLRVYKSGAAFADLSATCQKTDPTLPPATTPSGGGGGGSTTNNGGGGGGTSNDFGTSNGGGATSGTVQTAGATSSSSAGAGVSQGWIAAAVIVPVVIVAAVVVAIAMLSRRRIKSDGSSGDARFNRFYDDGGGVREQWNHNTFPL